MLAIEVAADTLIPCILYTVKFLPTDTSKYQKLQIEKNISATDNIWYLEDTFFLYYNLKKNICIYAFT